MSYDPDVPKSLKEAQQWFAGVITQPLDDEDKICPVTPSGQSIEKEASVYLNPSPTLKPFQRIQIYNQQYWWRLLSVLHDVYPMVVRLFGYKGFNREIGEPFLVKYVPDNWNINFIGDRLPEWIEENYTHKDKQLVFDSACIDWAYSQSFTAPSFEPIDQTAIEIGNMEGLLKLKLYLQPHIHLFTHKLNLFKFRTEFLKQEPDYWEMHPFPSVDKGKRVFHILYRNKCHNVVYKELSYGEFLLLDRFIDGETLEHACGFLSEQDKEICEEASKHLSLWLKRFITSGWLTLDR